MPLQLLHDVGAQSFMHCQQPLVLSTSSGLSPGALRGGERISQEINTSGMAPQYQVALGDRYGAAMNRKPTWARERPRIQPCARRAGRVSGSWRTTQVQYP